MHSSSLVIIYVVVETICIVSVLCRGGCVVRADVLQFQHGDRRHVGRVSCQRNPATHRCGSHQLLGVEGDLLSAVVVGEGQE